MKFELPKVRMYIAGPRVCASLLLVALLLPDFAVSADGLPSSDFSGRSAEKRPELLDERRQAPLPLMTLPPLAPPRENSGQILKGFFARKITVVGSSVFTPEELATIVTPYENRAISMEDLESLRRDLTLLYVKRGFINSGAIIPDQTITDGQITIQVIEGRLADITIYGNRWFSDGFLRDRIALGAEVPLNVGALQERLQLLQQDQRIERIHAEMRPGAKAGDAGLRVKVDERPPISAWLAFNNYQSPSVGAERGVMTLAHQNLTGHGDVLSLTYGYSDGLNPLLDTWYAVPLNAYDTTLMFRYRKDNTTVVDKVFGPLDIESKTESYELSIRQPLYRSLSQEFAISLSLAHEHNETSLSGEPFSFYAGVDNGESNVVPLRVSLDWTYRTQKQVLTARSRFSFGLDAWDATVHDNAKIPDGKFFAWLGQLQWARILDFQDIQLIARADIQKANHSLLPIEQMGIGGRYTVRGYRENLLVRDEAFITSLEARLPLVQNARWAEYLQVAPFIDYGRGTNVDMPTSGPKDIAGVGAGLRWGTSLFKVPFDLKADAEIYWGYQWRTLSNVQYEDIQDDGIHFQIGLTAFF